jgi:hypothetical protein
MEIDGESGRAKCTAGRRGSGVDIEARLCSTRLDHVTVFRVLPSLTTARSELVRSLQECDILAINSR